MKQQCGAGAKFSSSESAGRVSTIFRLKDADGRERESVCEKRRPWVVLGCWGFVVGIAAFLLLLCRCCLLLSLWMGGGRGVCNKFCDVDAGRGLTVGIFWGINSDRENQVWEILLIFWLGPRPRKAVSDCSLLFSFLPPTIVQCEGMCVCACAFVRPKRQGTGKAEVAGLQKPGQAWLTSPAVNLDARQEERSLLPLGFWDHAAVFQTLVRCPSRGGQEARRGGG